MKAVTLSAGLSQKRHWVAELKCAPETEELELQTLPGLTLESATLRTEASRLDNFVGTLGRKRGEVSLLTSEIRDLATHSKKL